MPVSYTHLDVYKRQAVGFAIYDDAVFGSAVYFDDIRLLMGALPVNDIASVMNGKADLMIQKWSTPIPVSYTHLRKSGSHFVCFRRR